MWPGLNLLINHYFLNTLQLKQLVAKLAQCTKWPYISLTICAGNPPLATQKACNVESISILRCRMHQYSHAEIVTLPYPNNEGITSWMIIFAFHLVLLKYLPRFVICSHNITQATGLDAWASRVKCPARFVSHLQEICIYIWVVYSLCFFCCLFITVTWWYVWCIERASGNQEEVQACLVTLWLFIISCYSLYKTTLCLLCSWFENNPHFQKYSMDFHV